MEDRKDNSDSLPGKDANLQENNSLEINQRPIRNRRPSMGSKRSIRDIKRDNEDNKKNDGLPKFADDRRFASRRYKSAGRGKFLIGVGVILAFILILLMVGNVTHSANLAIETNSYRVNVDEVVLAENDFSYQTISVTDEKVLVAESTESVEVPAEGLITVLNKTNSAQRLVATTRFQTNDGMIYRTPSAITIPAASGGNPGQLTNVRVVADKTGDQGNGYQNAKLTVPGLAGTELEGEVYATTVSGFEGGFVGTRAVPNESEANLAVEELTENLSNNFTDLAQLLLGDEKVLLGVNSEISYEDSISGESSDEAIVKVIATAEVAVMNETQLVNKLASQVPGQVDTNNLELLNRGMINFTLIEEDEIKLSFDANPLLGYELNIEQISEEILGLSADAVDETLSNNNAIDKYELIVSPFWRSSVPDNIDKVKVVVEGDENAIVPTDLEPDREQVVEDNSEAPEATEVIRTEISE